MSKLLKNHELHKFKKLLDMAGGYVLGFSNREFKLFVMDSVNKNIYDDKYAVGSGSEAKRLECFLDIEPKNIAIQLLSDLFDQCKESVCDNILYKECKGILNNLKDRIEVEERESLVAIESLREVDIRFVRAQVAKMQKRLEKDDFEGVITLSHSLIETVVRWGIEESGEVIDVSDRGDIKKALKRVLVYLNLDLSVDEPMRKISSGISSVVDGLAMIANVMGDRHGKDGDYYHPRKEHAKLCMNLSHTVSEFIIESCKNKKTKTKNEL